MIIRDETGMRELGVEIAKTLSPGDVVTLSGPLGAGKTVLAKAIIGALGFTGEVTSPTFAIVHEYREPTQRLPVVHADLYRLDDPDELGELGLEDEAFGVSLIEWPEKGGTAFSNADVAITIQPNVDGSRRVEVKDKKARA